MTETRFAIRDRLDGRFIGLDKSSGGYPWKPTGPQQVELFPTKQKAIEYCEVMGWRRSSDSYGALTWEVVEVKTLVMGLDRICFQQYDALRKAPL